MATYGGMVVTDGRVLLASELEEQPSLAVLPREIRIDGTVHRSDERINILRSLAREAAGRRRAVAVLPPQREQFLPVYQALAERHSDVVSLHLQEAFDPAARTARICRSLMQPFHQIHVYEAKTLEGGLEFLLTTALGLVDDGATAQQLLTLLRYLETHMLTFLLAAGASPGQPWTRFSAFQRVRSMVPFTETLLYFEPKTGRLDVISQGAQLHAQLGALLTQRWAPLRYRIRGRYRGYEPAQLEQLQASLLAAGVPEAPQWEPITASFLPGLPQQFIELLFLPTDEDLRRLFGLVQDLVWWKGAA